MVVANIVSLPAMMVGDNIFFLAMMVVANIARTQFLMVVDYNSLDQQ